MRELLLMAQARRSDQWWHTSSLLAMLANVHRDPKTSPVHPREFHPVESAKPKRKVPLCEALRQLGFVKSG